MAIKQLFKDRRRVQIPGQSNGVFINDQRPSRVVRNESVILEHEDPRMGFTSEPLELIGCTICHGPSGHPWLLPRADMVASPINKRAKSSSGFLGRHLFAFGARL